MLDPANHIALAVIDREWPGRYLEVTEGYCRVYQIPQHADQVVGQTVGDLFPSVLDPEDPWGQLWRQRFDRAVLGHVVGDADLILGDSGVAAFVVVPCRWQGTPALLLRVQATTAHVGEDSLAIAQAVLDPAGERLGVDHG